MTAPSQNPTVWLEDYTALTDSVGFVPLERSKIEVTGPDRARWLHNLCTNEIKKLAIGRGCEVFFTTVQGKTLGHGFVFAEPETLVIDTVAGQAPTLLKHLDRYLISEQVVLTDCSDAEIELLLMGRHAGNLIEQLGGAAPPAEVLAHLEIEVDEKCLRIRRADFAPEAYLISVARVDGPWLVARLHALGARQCMPEAGEALRIEHGSPLFGQDISDQNLPQELARDARAISFVKGCYLGQETVARIDALGHVNKLLVGLKFSGPEIPAVGCELRAAGQVAGSVTSATYSPLLRQPLALGFVRHTLAKPGTALESAAGGAEVVSLPLPRPR